MFWSFAGYFVEKFGLERIERSTKTAAGLVRRAQIVLMIAGGKSVTETARAVRVNRRIVRCRVKRFNKERIDGLKDKGGRGRAPVFPPEVALQLVKIACEMPDKVGRSLSQWDYEELARELERSGIVGGISSETVRRILTNHRLKPWRVHMWLGKKTPRDEAFQVCVKEICDSYTRELRDNEIVLSLDEKTSLQPRVRKAATLAAQPGAPVRVEHE
jgi:transposase